MGFRGLWTVRRAAWSSLLLGLGLLGCESWAVQGARKWRSRPVRELATFHTPSCTMMRDGRRVKGPSMKYVLAHGRESFVLLELSGSGGSEIENYWRDGYGHNFASYLNEGKAYHFIIPDDQNQPGVRYVFSQYSVVKTASGFSVKGQPSAQCLMLKRPAQDTPKPRRHEPDVGVPPLSANQVPVCVTGVTQECVGPGACRGGQQCLPDGSGYSACDCGSGTLDETDAGSQP